MLVECCRYQRIVIGMEERLKIGVDDKGNSKLSSDVDEFDASTWIGKCEKFRIKVGSIA